MTAPELSPYLLQSVIPAPVGLVLVRTPTGANAMTVSLFSEVAHFPASMWISIDPRAHTHSILLETGRFSFITLHEGQAGLAMACGTVSGRDSDKCAGLELYENGEGFLFLEDALAATACTVRERVAVGDHTLFIGNMLSGKISGRRTARRQLLLSDLQRA